MYIFRSQKEIVLVLVLDSIEQVKITCYLLEKYLQNISYEDSTFFNVDKKMKMKQICRLKILDGEFYIREAGFIKEFIGHTDVLSKLSAACKMNLTVMGNSFKTRKHVSSYKVFCMSDDGEKTLMFNLLDTYNAGITQWNSAEVIQEYIDYMLYTIIIELNDESMNVKTCSKTRSLFSYYMDEVTVVANSVRCLEIQEYLVDLFSRKSIKIYKDLFDGLPIS